MSSPIRPSTPAPQIPEEPGIRHEKLGTEEIQNIAQERLKQAPGYLSQLITASMKLANNLTMPVKRIYLSHYDPKYIDAKNAIETNTSMEIVTQNFDNEEFAKYCFSIMKPNQFNEWLPNATPEQFKWLQETLSEEKRAHILEELDKESLFSFLIDEALTPTRLSSFLDTFPGLYLVNDTSPLALILQNRNISTELMGTFFRKIPEEKKVETENTFFFHKDVWGAFPFKSLYRQEPSHPFNKNPSLIEDFLKLCPPHLRTAIYTTPDEEGMTLLGLMICSPEHFDILARHCPPDTKLLLTVSDFCGKSGLKGSDMAYNVWLEKQLLGIETLVQKYPNYKNFLIDNLSKIFSDSVSNGSILSKREQQVFKTLFQLGEMPPVKLLETLSNEEKTAFLTQITGTLFNSAISKEYRDQLLKIIPGSEEMIVDFKANDGMVNKWKVADFIRLKKALGEKEKINLSDLDSKTLEELMKVSREPQDVQEKNVKMLICRALSQQGIEAPEITITKDGQTISMSPKLALALLGRPSINFEQLFAKPKTLEDNKVNPIAISFSGLEQALLMSHSDYFKSLWAGSFSDREADRVVLELADPEEIERVIELLINPDLPFENIEEAINSLHLADRLLIPAISNRAVQWLKNYEQSLSIDEQKQLIEALKKNGIDQLSIWQTLFPGE